jgi:hypothetical protein
VGETKKILAQRLDYPVSLESDTDLGLGGPERTAWELLSRWRRDLFKGGIELAWDLAFLQEEYELLWDEIFAKARVRGELKALVHGLRVLGARMSIPLPETPEVPARYSAFLQKVVGFQYCRLAGEPDNCFLRLAVNLCCLGPGHLSRGVVAGLKDIWRAFREGGLRRLKTDFQQARQASFRGR